MFKNVSLKYRIAVIIFILEGFMMAAVLWATLGNSYEASEKQQGDNEQVIMELVKGIALPALITEEYSELQPYITDLLNNNAINAIHVADEFGVVISSTDNQLLGLALPSLDEKEGYAWRQSTISVGNSQFGEIAIEYSRTELTTAYQNARNYGIYLALSGMLIIAFIGITVGFLLTRRLEKITAIASQLASGNFNVRTQVTGDDEVGKLGESFDLMIDSLEQKQRQLESGRKQLQDIMDHSPAVVYVKGLDGRYTFINQRYLDIFGITREQVIGKTDFEILSKEAAAHVTENDKQVLAQNKALELEEVIPQVDGTSHYYISEKFPLLNKDKKPFALCGISTDITERKKQEEQLKRAQKMDALGKLTGGVAHDFNNILNIIMGYSSLIEAIGNSENQKIIDSAKHISKASERGAKLTQKMLAFSRQKNTESQPTDLNEIILNNQSMLQKVVTVKIEIALDLASDLWSCKIDPADFEDTLINLALNSMHAIGDKGQITFKTENTKIDPKESVNLDIPEGEYVMLCVKDDGSGMDNKTLEQVFDPFFTTKGTDGTGLGLSQVYGFVIRSQGTIKVESELGKGTQFNLYFPKSEALKQLTEELPVKENMAVERNEKILVVDDEAELVELATTMLSMHGYQVFGCTSGKEAIELLGREQVDLLITDVVMPEMDGFELTAKVIKSHPNIKIQMVSGYNSRDDKSLSETQLRDSKNNILYKPYTNKMLLNKVQSILGSS